MGDPSEIGIGDLSVDIFTGERNPSIEPMKPNEIALFWACGVTPQVVAEEAKLPLLITHGSRRPFVTDWKIRDLPSLGSVS